MYRNTIYILTLREIKEMLETIRFERISTVPPVRPKGGDVYVYRFQTGKAEDWRADSYTWLNLGSSKTPTKNPTIRKDFFAIRVKDNLDGRKYSNGFRRISYRRK